MVYIVGVLVTAILTNSQICWIASSVLSVILFNFMFTFPHFSLVAYGEGYPITFAVMLIVSLITGSISNKMKSQVKKSTETAYRTKILFDANQLIQNAKNDEEIIGVTISQIKKLLDKETFVYLSKNKKYYTKVLESLEEIKDLEEVNNETIQLVLNKNTKAGYGTEYYKNDNFAYIPLSGNKNMFGVVVIKLKQNPIEPFENSILLSIIGECSLAIENYYNLKEKELNEILAKNEQVRANLLRAISHDLRTPLTSIMGNSDNLLVNSKSLDEELKMQMYSEIYEDSLWLLNLVENILSITKLEDGKIKLNYTTELIDDIIDEALKHINKNKIKHHIKVEPFNELLLVNVDVRLIIQLFINLIDNAIKYTPEGSTININVSKDESRVIVEVSDNGPGIKDKDRIDEISYFIMMRTTIGDDFEDDVEEMLDELDITLNDKEQKELFGILDEIYYEMPSLILNGYRPLELLEEAEEYDEDYWSFDDLTDEEKIEVYINAYLNINGTIKIDKLLKIINEEHNIKITKNKLIKAIKQIEEIKIYEDYIMGKENQKEDFEYLLSVKKLDEYYIIEDIDEMYDEIDEVESLIKEVIKNYGLSNNICDEIIALLNVNGFNEDILYCILEHHGIKMTLKKQHQLYQNIKIHTNNYRVWYLNGFKINDNKHIKKQEKIGRNSKCPCGSGKKYKQCCGK